jgi:hypothetical protein
MLALWAVLLAAQQQLRVHALAHVGDRRAADFAAQGARHGPASEHEASVCAICLACAAAASMMPAAPVAAPGLIMSWFAPTAAAHQDERRPVVPARFIRGPPPQPQLG